jgi:hypothetical protein
MQTIWADMSIQRTWRDENWSWISLSWSIFTAKFTIFQKEMRIGPYLPYLSTTVKCPNTFTSLTIRQSSTTIAPLGCQVVKYHIIQSQLALTDSDLEIVMFLKCAYSNIEQSWIWNHPCLPQKLICYVNFKNQCGCGLSIGK